MLRSIKILGLLLLFLNVANAQDIKPPNCFISGTTITCGNNSLTPSGGSTSPGGSNTQLQYNNAGAFGGISGWTTNGTTTVTGNALNLTTLKIGAGSNITSSGIGGALGSAAFQNTGTSGANVPLLNGTNTWSGTNTYNALLTATASISANTISLGGAALGSNAVAAAGQVASIGASGTSPGFYSYLDTDSVARVRIGMDVTNTASLAFGAGGASARDAFLYRLSSAVFNMGSSVTLSDATLNLGGLNTTGTITLSNLTLTGNGAASRSVELYSGTVFTGGSGTTTFPQILIQPTGTTAVTTWSTSGTIIGTNVVSGFAGNFLDFHTAGAASVYRVGTGGVVVSNGSSTILAATSIPAGGTAGVGYKFSSATNFGIFFGSGAPTLSAAKGSLYLRSDGSTTNDRAYINTDGNTAWTALTTAS